MVSGGIHAYVPAADILVVLYASRANPKSVILSVLFRRLSGSSIRSLINTLNEKKNKIMLTLEIRFVTINDLLEKKT